MEYIIIAISLLATLVFHRFETEKLGKGRVIRFFMLLFVSLSVWHFVTQGFHKYYLGIVLPILAVLIVGLIFEGIYRLRYRGEEE